MLLGMLCLARALRILPYPSDKFSDMLFGLICPPGGKTKEAREAISEHERVECMWAMVRGTPRDARLSFLLARKSLKGERGYA